MTVYLGEEKVKICLGGVTYRLNIPFNDKTDNSVMLLSSDNYILKDIDGTLLLTKEAD